jgi:serine/threonine protein phosphatase PrpC
MLIIGKSDKGRVRRNNEDSFSYCRVSGGGIFAVVCDGMGGAASGEMASDIAVKELIRLASDELNDMSDLKRARSVIRNHMRYVNNILYKTALEKPNLSGMGTTVVCVYIVGKEALFVNVGDSRAYIINENKIEQVTKDHSMVEVMVQNGQLTKEQAREHPSRNIITMALGPDEDILPSCYECSIEDEDIILLCSDGLSNMLTDEEIAKIVNKDFENAPMRLINAANNAGGCDNITVVIMKHKGGKP